MTRVRVIAAAAALSMLAVVTPAFAAGAGAASDQAPTFIVTLRSGEPREVAADHARRYGADVEFVYEHALRGYAARVSEGQIGALARDSRVARVERDQVVHAVQSPQTNPTWGLDRIDERALPLDGNYSYGTTGAGVKAYIIDTGIRATHKDFGSRVSSFGFTAFDDGRKWDDCHGHGTHVAGTVGGTTWGVAKAASLFAVRVLDCNGSGSWSGVIAGIDWVTANAVKPAVANMSLGGGASDSVDQAVQNSIASGVSYAIAAGNGNRVGIAQDACKSSPARVPEAMTIGATDKTDTKTSWSNYGDCVDWFAPGASITSAWYSSDTATNTISGTSMAAPHVAGAAALYLEAAPNSTAQQVRDALFEATTKDVVTSSNTANDHLLYTGSVEPTDTTAPNAPTSLQTGEVSSSAISLAWTDNSDDESGFRVKRSVNGTDWATAGTVGANVTSFQDTGLAADTSYTYQVFAFNGAGDSVASNTVTATTEAATSSASIKLTATGYKVKGAHTVDLSWDGAASTSVDVYRNGARVTTTANDGAYTDTMGNKGGGSYTYKICEAGTSTCSGEVTVTF